MTTRLAPSFVFVFAMALVSTPSLSDPPPGKGPSGINLSSEASNGSNGSNGSKESTAYKNSSNKQGSTPTGFSSGELITAGITLVAARELAFESGATGYKPLPPGIAKNLARGKPLPPGIAKRNIPNSLLSGLPRYDGYEWLSAGSDLLLINTASRVIADVLTNALR